MVDPTLLSNSRLGIVDVSVVADQPSTGEPSNPQDLTLSNSPQPAAAQHVSEPNFSSGAGRRETFAFFETRSEQMKTLLDAAYMVASTSAPVLLTGETGVGKSVLARQIHEWSSWREQAFVVVDCASISEHLLEGALFDRATGLVRSSRDRQERAMLRGSTIFFNKVSDLSELAQARLLQFVEEQHFNAIFEQSHSGTPHRIIMACNRNLAAEVAAKRFREDLFFRISVINLELPPLRDRFEDIRALANYLLYNVSLTIERPGLQLSSDAVAVLTRHRWPGNVRELRDAIERAAILTRSDIITSRLLSKAIAAKNADLSTPLRSLTSLEEVERQHILQVLSQAGSLRQAATILGIDLSTLWRKRRRYNLDRDCRKPHGTDHLRG